MDTDQAKKGYRRELYTEQARRDRFKKIAEARTNRLLNDIRLLGNTGNKTLYRYDQADVDKIFETIEKKLVEARSRFKTSKKDKPFTLS